MMTYDAMIEVIQGAKDGKQIQCNSGHGKADWSNTSSIPAFNFNHKDYRIKPPGPSEWWLSISISGRSGVVYYEPTCGCVHVREVIE